MRDIFIAIFSVLVLMLQMISVFVYLTHFFGFKTSNIRIYIMLMVSALCSKISLKIENTSYHIEILLYMVLFILMLKVLEGSLYKKFFHYCFLCFFLTVQQRIAYIIYNTDTNQSKNSFFFLFILVTFVFVLFVFLLKRFNFDNDVYMTREEYLILSIIPFSSVLLLHFIIIKSEIMMSMIYLFLFMVNIVAIFLYYFILYKNYQLQILQIDHIQSNFYEDFLKQERELSALKHDLKNIISSIGYYLAEKEYDQASKLISELSSYQSLNTKYTGILAVDAILNNKLKVMCELGLKYHLDCQIPKDLDVSMFEIELCSILGNLLDNAIESVKRLNDKKLSINILMRYHRYKLIIKVVNPCNINANSNFNCDKVTSSKGKRYGIGLRSIKDKVLLYKGYYNFEIRDSNFHAVIVLPMNQMSYKS